MSMLSIFLAISAVAVLITCAAAAIQDGKSRTVSRITWIPAAVIGGVCTVLFWLGRILDGFTALDGLILGTSLLFSALFAVFSCLGMFGAADAKALILISLTVPVTPFADWVFPSLAVSAIINSGILMLAIPVGCLIYNLIHKNHAPFWILCSGYPVPGAEIADHFGFLAEEITETNGAVSRRFIPLRDAVFSLRKGKRTKNEAEISLCKNCDAVWITIGIPLLIPITCGLFLAVFGVSILDWILLL